jgi:mannose-6-phosphate isomerase-like protein (cupin superfamily)
MPNFDLESTYLGLDGQGHVTPMRVGPDFWKTIDQNSVARGTMVTVNSSEGDWDHWEIHPKGDEVLVLLEGEMQVVFENHEGDKVFDLLPGGTLIVPAGTWHRAQRQKNVRMLFITYGEGTAHKPFAASRDT